MVDLLKKELELKLGQNIESRGDAELLAHAVQETIDYEISYNTIRRFFGVSSKVKPNKKTLDILSKFTDWINDKSKMNKDDVSAAANDYLKTLGFVSIGYSWIKILEVSFSDYESNQDFYNDKINTAKFYFDKVLPRAEYHYKSAISGSSNIMNFKFN